MALDLQLISLDLLVLYRRLVFSPLELIADERPSAQPEQRSDARARAWMTHGGTDDSTGRGAAKGADGSLTAARILVGKDGLTPPM